MLRQSASFSISDYSSTKKKLLNWANQFEICSFLDNHAYQLPHHAHECLVAAGALHVLEASAGSAFDQLKTFSLQHRDWLFGHLGFDLKNETEKLFSAHNDGIGFPDLFFFVPEFVVELNASAITIHAFGEWHQQIHQQILDAREPMTGVSKTSIQSRFSQQQYIDTVERLRKHILRGDCYEINLCQEFYSLNAEVNPVKLYETLSETSPMPFGGFYKLRDKFLICASPERYLKKTGRLLISQPIKGTAPRDLQHAEHDEALREGLSHSAKDRSENIMIVDLVRNDLSRVCEEGSVKVEELYGVYRFPQVYQLISTISGLLPADTHWVEAVRASFPMGSMTGAPKKRVLQLIEQYEKTKRGIFSGALGYVSPDGDLDFNVVIRSILYNQGDHYLAYQVGSAITYSSDAEKEYEECLLKATAIRQVLAAS